jgi:hypothetical protein
MLEDVDEEDLGEIPFDLVPYPYNRVPNSFGQDKPEYPELRKLLMRTLDILDRGCGVLSPYAPKGKLVYYDVASIDIDPDSAILRVSDWQGANEIMTLLNNEHIIRWDEDMEAYELVKRVRESVEEDEEPSEISYELQPYPFNQIPRDIAEHFRNEMEDEEGFSDIQASKDPQATALAESLISDILLGLDPYNMMDLAASYAGEEERILALLDNYHQGIVDEMMTNGAAEKILYELIDWICSLMDIALENDDE